MNISKENIYKLQKVQNAAARLILGGRRRDSASEARKKLHWLSIESRITFKVLLMVHKIINGQIPQNFDLQYKKFNGRPDDFLLLETPNFKTAYGKRIFAYHGSRLWNALPATVRAEDNVDVFKKKVKTILFDGSEELKKRAFRYN